MRVRFLGDWVLIGLTLAAIFVRLAYVWTLPIDRLKWPDEQAFDEIAWQLAQTGRYESSAYRATPVLPWFLAAVYEAAGHNYRAARVGQAVLSGAIVLAVYGIGASLFGRATGYVAAVGAAFYPPLIYLSGLFYAEYMFTVLLVVTVFFLVQWWQKKRIRWALAAGIALGLGALCRPVFLAFVPFAAAYVGWGAGVKAWWRSTAILLAAWLAVIGPWTVRNALVFHHFIPISNGFGWHLWWGNNDASRGDADDRHLLLGGDLWQERVNKLPDEAQRQSAWATEKRMLAEYARLDEIEQDHMFAREGIEWMKQHPATFVRLSGRRTLELYSAFSRTRTQNEDVSRRNQVIATVSFYPVLAVGLIGAVVAWRRQRASIIVPAAIASITMAYMLTTACTRFRLPLDALWLLLAAVAATAAWEKLRASHTGQTAV
jgi:4-amino-4-deoxy-L-arabinose transferase-like glycosyltransferase